MIQLVYYKIKPTDVTSNITFEPYKSYVEIDEYFEQEFGGVHTWKFYNF